MRLALILIAVHFFFSGTLVHQTAGAPQVSFDLADPRCTRYLPPLIIVSQIYDIINTRNQMVRYPLARERDWWSLHFAGPSGRNVTGIAFGVAFLDAIKWKVTAHSAQLRCLLEVNQLQTTIDAIRVTRPR